MLGDSSSRYSQHLWANVDADEPSLTSDRVVQLLEVGAGTAGHVDDRLALPKLQPVYGATPVAAERGANATVVVRRSIAVDGSGSLAVGPWHNPNGV